MTFCPDMVSNPVISFYFNLFALGEGDVMNVWFSDEASGAPDGVTQASICKEWTSGARWTT